MPPPSDSKLLEEALDVLGLFHFIYTSAGNSANVKDIGRLRRHRKANKAEGHFGGDSATLLCRRYQVRTERRLHRRRRRQCRSGRAGLKAVVALLLYHSMERRRGIPLVRSRLQWMRFRRSCSK